MHRNNELRLCERATALGESGDAAAFAELVGLTRSESARVRRLAASALGKLAGIVPAGAAVDALVPLLADAHPQCRQYAAKALGAFGAAAEKALPDLRDLHRNPAEKDYVKRSVLAAGMTIREAIRIAGEQAIRKIGMLKKQKLYQQEGKRMISLYPADKPRLAAVLREKLSRYVRLSEPAGTP